MSATVQMDTQKSKKRKRSKSDVAKEDLLQNAQINLQSLLAKMDASEKSLGKSLKSTSVPDKKRPKLDKTPNSSAARPHTPSLARQKVTTPKPTKRASFEIASVANSSKEDDPPAKFDPKQGKAKPSPPSHIYSKVNPKSAYQSFPAR